MELCLAGCWDFFTASAFPCDFKERPRWVSMPSDLLEEYSMGDTLGRGAYGVVVAGTHRSTGTEVAVKFFDRSRTGSREVQSEAALLKCLGHRNIVGCSRFIGDARHPCLVMERYAGGDLVEGLQRRLREEPGPHPCEAFAHIGAQMACAIQYLHSFNIVHRDVKSENFMLDRKDIMDPNLRIALGDFGAARALAEGERLGCAFGTKMFWAPESYAMDYGLKVDIWAMGVVMYSLLVCRFPFRDEVDVRRREPLYPKRLPPDARDYLKSMLQKIEAKRPSAEMICGHPWICREVGAAPEDTTSSAGGPALELPEEALKGDSGCGGEGSQHSGSDSTCASVDRSPSVSTKGSDGIPDLGSIHSEAAAGRVCVGGGTTHGWGLL
mmetsp:Transcript_52000/g.168935  ORF Transcript_52000/g.168935 Transcript_52000/m.168935 type:complete len:382 (-) Transcript_52000:40-1185(-)|eukprot:CAMPEP_0203861754 /NCGR_PEP_ID=MMETSP0359-20131031/13196_1 /ASSEMBLY_ACC=CAM_ASM_000338 /TAXON_ID=268821 /ORGANISM="Scrippsiella Hangoei, Strain SHTV-5" /LENGTH=381 /DNA_ID=CAMNT_0050779047 /DNA_START=80 /DNA_END=1225 /DNA_ORIENTATION=+